MNWVFNKIAFESVLQKAVGRENEKMGDGLLAHK